MEPIPRDRTVIVWTPVFSHFADGKMVTVEEPALVKWEKASYGEPEGFYAVAQGIGVSNPQGGGRHIGTDADIVAWAEVPDPLHRREG